MIVLGHVLSCIRFCLIPGPYIIHWASLSEVLCPGTARVVQVISGTWIPKHCIILGHHRELPAQLAKKDWRDSPSLPLSTA